MTDARLRRLWHGTGILTALGALATGAVAQGCSDEAAPAGDLSFGLGAESPRAFDATPDPDGKTLYFTGLSADGEPGVFKAPADGSGKAPTAVVVGEPFTAPMGIATSTDGKQLFIADPGADVGTDKGGILGMAAEGGEPSVIPGTEDANPRNLEVADEKGKDVIYFTGSDRSDGQAGVFSVPAAGGSITTVIKGDPFRDPSGIAVAKDGTIYVADTVSSAEGGADIIKVSGGKAEVVLSNIRVGYPCGIALDTTDSVLFVSALDSDTLTDIVIKIELASKKPTNLAPKEITSFSESAGLHRAKNQDVFGWADSSGSTGTKGGQVFTVK